MFNKLTIDDYDLLGKKVLLRVDFNVPLNEQGNITSDKRIVESLPTIKRLQEKGAKIIICSHLGRPDGKPNPKFSLKPVAERLRKLLESPVFFNGDLVTPENRKFINNMENGEIFMLENLRFDPGEENNDLNFAKKLASIADIFCNDAFGTMHRAHASTVGVAKLLPNCIGLLVQKEITMFDKILSKPQKPVLAILGGAKIKDKINMIHNILNVANKVIIGGAMAYTFLVAKGYNVGASTIEKDKVPIAKMLLDIAEKNHVKIILPVDHVVAQEFSFMADSITIPTSGFKANDIGMDIGMHTIKLFKNEINSARTIFWNGPMGVFEFDKFSVGTRKIAEAVAESKATTIVGGGDSISALSKFGLEKKITHISTGGGASLQYLEGNGLVGLKAISDKIEVWYEIYLWQLENEFFRPRCKQIYKRF